MPCNDFLLLHPRRSLASGKRGLCLYRDSPYNMRFCPYGYASDCPDAIPAPFRGCIERPVDEAEMKELREATLRCCPPKAEAEAFMGVTYAVPKEALK